MNLDQTLYPRDQDYVHYIPPAQDRRKVWKSRGGGGKDQFGGRNLPLPLPVGDKHELYKYSVQDPGDQNWFAKCFQLCK